MNISPILTLLVFVFLTEALLAPPSEMFSHQTAPRTQNQHSLPSNKSLIDTLHQCYDTDSNDHFSDRTEFETFTFLGTSPYEDDDTFKESARNCNDSILIVSSNIESLNSKFGRLILTLEDFEKADC